MFFANYVRQPTIFWIFELLLYSILPISCSLILQMEMWCQHIDWPLFSWSNTVIAQTNIYERAKQTTYQMWTFMHSPIGSNVKNWQHLLNITQTLLTKLNKCSSSILLLGFEIFLCRSKVHTRRRRRGEGRGSQVSPMSIWRQAAAAARYQNLVFIGSLSDGEHDDSKGWAPRRPCLLSSTAKTETGIYTNPPTEIQ